MFSEELKVDHVTVAGRDLRAMRSALEAAGLKAEYGGPHSNHATEMALTSFPDGSYLELIAIQPNADPKAVAAHEWRKSLEGDAGPTAWAVRPTDLPAEVERLRKAGISASEPRKNGRKRPDGVQLDWETAQIGPGNGTFFPFLIHDFTPRERRAYPGGKPTTEQWTGITKVVLAVKDLDAAVKQFQLAYKLPAPERQDDPEFGAKLAWFRGTPVVLAAPLSPQSWLQARIAQFGEAPCAFILGSHSGVTAAKPPANWFGKSVIWFDPHRLGWHLGWETR
ncbi:MAG TPA: VOC family protein [Bryobacteraceae bacterium]|nr:VOC family protein [Bryobacteraceae bacterium]